MQPVSRNATVGYRLRLIVFCSCKRSQKPCGDQIPGAHRRKRPMTVDPSPSSDKHTKPEPFVLEDFGSNTRNNSAIPSLNPAYFSPSLWITRLIQDDNEAELLLQKFKLEFSQFFPFVVIPPEQNFLDLKNKNPFVTIVVLMIGCRHDNVLQTTIAKKIRELISYSTLIKGEKNLDLLQGVMLFLAWWVTPNFTQN